MEFYTGLGQFSSTNKYNVKGNILSIIYGDEYQEHSEMILNGGFDGGPGPMLFTNSINLVSAENLSLPSTTRSWCYNDLFRGCTSLTIAPKLPATTLASYCYQTMFYGCTSLTSAPELPATTLAVGCYFGMFSGCTSLEYIKAMFITLDNNQTNNWVNNVAATGTFVKNSAATWNKSGKDGIPNGWTVETADE